MLISLISGDAVDCDEIQFESTIYTPAQPSELIFRESLEAEHEGVAFAIHPKLKAIDTNVSYVPFGYHQFYLVL